MSCGCKGERRRTTIPIYRPQQTLVVGSELAGDAYGILLQQSASALSAGFSIECSVDKIGSRKTLIKPGRMMRGYFELLKVTALIGTDADQVVLDVFEFPGPDSDMQGIPNEGSPAPGTTLLSYEIPDATTVQLDAGDSLNPTRSKVTIIADSNNAGNLEVALGGSSFVAPTPGDPGTFFPLPPGAPINEIPVGPGVGIFVRPAAGAGACYCYLIQA